ncbi:Cellulose synthase-like protein D2 [Castilleja foliolosa]|uniref:Cellulose synthase-like protein D2 n=1 Tax=Castilleja foliolosa TaxID=1961234 RepID=A0ABD3BS30_9LAMI
MAERSFRHSDSQSGGGIFSTPPTVTFTRRTSSGRYVNLSRDSLDSDISGIEFSEYTVHIPPTPDNQPMDEASLAPISQRVEEQYVSSSLFTGGYKSVTRTHLMDKVIESESTHPQMAGAIGSFCAIQGCDGNVMSDGRGEDILPCECDFKICRDCFNDAIKTGDSICPGCKEAYKNTELTVVEPTAGQQPVSKMERRLSLMKSVNRSAIVRSHSGLARSGTGVDFDHNRWLFETKGTYGYGNAIWPKDGGGFGDDKNEDDQSVGGEAQELLGKPWRPLTRKLKIPAAVLSPYR